MPKLSELLAASPYVVFDGAMGTMVQSVGLDDGGAAELWNVEHPELITDVYRGYLEAGAQVVTTNTFGGTRPRLDMYGLGDRVIELNRAGATLARLAAEPFGALVAGDLGPTGELMEPLGSLTIDGASELFCEQLRGLVEGGIDLVLIETMSDLSEVEAAVRAAHAEAPDLPVIATMSFDTNLRTMMGVSPAAAVSAISEFGVTAVGANCGRGPEEMETIMAQMAEVRPEGLLLIAQSNAGLPVLVGDRFEYDCPAPEMAAHATRLKTLGVELIGACCGSTPAHVRAMAEALATP